MYIGDNAERFLELCKPERALKRQRTANAGLAWPPRSVFSLFATAKSGSSKGSVMNIALKPEPSADKSSDINRKTRSQFEPVDHTSSPQAGGELAKATKQTREAYDCSKNALEAAVSNVARSFDALGQGTAALNRKIIEIAQRNVSSGFDLAKTLATAKTLAELVKLRATYWRKQFSVLTTQAEEVRALSVKVAADIATPSNAHVPRSPDEQHDTK